MEKIELLGEKIKRLHKRKKNLLAAKGIKFTNESIASVLRVSSSTVTAWKNGKRKIPDNMIGAIADKLDISESQLLDKAIWINGTKMLVNRSNVCYYQITSPHQTFSDLSPEEVRWVYQFRVSRGEI